MVPTVLLAGGALMVFLALATSFSIIGGLTAEKRAVGRSLAAVQMLNSAPQALAQEIDRPFSERVLAPAGERLMGLGKRITRADTVDRIRHKLDVAGNPAGWDVNRVIGLKALGLVVLGGLALLYCMAAGFTLTKAALVTGALGAFGYLLPNILLHNAGEKRSKLMQNALPDALDLLTISVEAGLGFDAAVSRVAKQTEGPLAAEFSRMGQEMQIGVGRLEAMRAMGERTTVADLKSFCLAMVQADRLGIPIGRVLRVQSHEMRVKRRQRAEERAMQLPVKMIFPLVLFILPCLFIVILGPAALQAQSFFNSQ